MNFNLVSDEDNGHRYTAYFGEQIEIPAGSKSYLNFAELHRENGHFLSQDATLTLTVPQDSVIPTHVFNDAGDVVSNEGITFTKTLAAGRYTTTQMQKILRQAIREMVGSDSGSIPPPLSSLGRLFYYDSYEPSNYDQNSQLVVNLSLSKTIAVQTDVAEDPTNNFNSILDQAGGYRKFNTIDDNQPVCFDNYGLGTLPIFHYVAKDTVEEQFAQVEVVINSPLDGAHGIDGSVFLGLYNENYAALPIPSGQSATLGGNRPRILTVDPDIGPVGFDPGEVATGSTDRTALVNYIQPNNHLFDVEPAGNNYAQDFKVKIRRSDGLGTPAIGYPQIKSIVFRGLVSRFDYTAGNIAGLAATTTFTLIEPAPGPGLGTGLTLTVTSNGDGEIGETEMAAAVCKILTTGTNYKAGEVLTMGDSGGVGVGTIQITVSRTCFSGVMEGLLQPDAQVVSDRDPDPSARTMGSGFTGGEFGVSGEECDSEMVVNTISNTCDLKSNCLSASAMIPACFCGVEVHGPDSNLPYQDAFNIYVAEDSTGEFIGKTTTTQNIDIAQMGLMDSVAVPASDVRIHMAIRTYKSDDLGDDKNIFFQVGYYTEGAGEFVPVYDSITDFLFFSDDKFIKGLPVTDLASQNIQAPFKPFFSTQMPDDAISEPHINAYDMNTNDRDAGNKKPSMIQKIQWTASSELARILGFEGQLGNGFPIMPSSDFNNPLTIAQVNVGLHWLNASYYVVIEELPLTNYKNKRVKQADGKGRIKKGMVKNILANIPLPFESAASAIVEESAADALLIGGLYEPPKKIIVDMKNNKIVTNQMSVRIFRMEDDKPAEELKQSVINFTIMGGEEIEE